MNDKLLTRREIISDEQHIIEEEEKEPLKQNKQHKRKVNPKIVQPISLENDINEPLIKTPYSLDDNDELVECKQDVFFFIETDKHIYYPGEMMICSANLRLKAPFLRAQGLAFNIKGKESFKFVSKAKNQRSLKLQRIFVNQTHVVCRFMPSELAAGDYTFIFKYRIPTMDPNIQQQQWPASFHQKRDIANRGELKLHTKFRVQALLVKIGTQEPFMKCRQRFFIAKKPFNPRLNFIEMAQCEVSRCCVIRGENKCAWLFSAGINQIRVKFERNFYLTNEALKARCYVDNTKATSQCNKIVVRLVRCIKAYGHVPLMPGQAQPANRQLFPFEENTVIAAQEYIINLKPGQKQEDYSQQIQLFLDDVLGTNRKAEAKQFKRQRATAKKPYKPEDLVFATHSMQPSTVGQVYNCLYTIIVNRISTGCANYPAGTSCLLTINPCEEQVSGFTNRMRPPKNWSPRVLDMRQRYYVNYTIPLPPQQVAAQGQQVQNQPPVAQVQQPQPPQPQLEIGDNYIVKINELHPFQRTQKEIQAQFKKVGQIERPPEYTPEISQLNPSPQISISEKNDAHLSDDDHGEFDATSAEAV